MLDAELQESASELDEIVVTASKSALFNSQRTGSSAKFTTELIASAPSIKRSIYDVARLVPQASASGSGMSFAGSNNRYNSFQIDGTVNNDVLWTGLKWDERRTEWANPISLDAIEEIQVVIAPFDVRQSGLPAEGLMPLQNPEPMTLKVRYTDIIINQDFAGTTAGRNVKKGKNFQNNPIKRMDLPSAVRSLKNKLIFFTNLEHAKVLTPARILSEMDRILRKKRRSKSLKS